MAADRSDQKDAGPPSSPRVADRRVLAAALLVAGWSVICYLSCLGGGFVFDDHVLIEDNPYIQDLGNTPLFFTSKDARIVREFAGLQDDTYRPVQSISYALSHALWGLDSGRFHLDDVLLHAATAVLLLFLLHRLTRRLAVALLAALLFAVHPVQVEAVSYLSGRSDQLSLFFSLLAFRTWLWQRERSSPPWSGPGLLSLTCFAAALLSKEMAVSLPGVVFLYSFLVGADSRRPRLRRALLDALPFAVLVILFAVVRTAALGRVAQTGVSDPTELLLIMVRVFAGYLQLFAWPATLTFFRDLDVSGPGSTLPNILAVITLLGFLVGTVVAWNKNRVGAFLLLSYLVTLLPVSNIIRMKTEMQERFLYTPSVFLFTLLAFGAVLAWERWIRNSSTAMRAGAALLVAILLVGLSLRTSARSGDWFDQHTLIQEEIRVHPEMGKLYYDLGMIHFRERQLDDAEDWLHRALDRKLDPLILTMTFDALGNIEVLREDDPAAEAWYRKALETTPNYLYPLHSLGSICVRRGDFVGARSFFEAALEVWPDDARILVDAGRASAAGGDLKSAADYFRRALALEPANQEIRDLLRRAEAGG